MTDEAQATTPETMEPAPVVTFVPEVPNESVAPAASVSESAPIVDAGAVAEVSSTPKMHTLSHLEAEAVTVFGEAEAFAKKVIAWVASKL